MIGFPLLALQAVFLPEQIDLSQNLLILLTKTSLVLGNQLSLTEKKENFQTLIELKAF